MRQTIDQRRREGAPVIAVQLAIAEHDTPAPTTSQDVILDLALFLAHDHSAETAGHVAAAALAFVNRLTLHLPAETRAALSAEAARQITGEGTATSDEEEGQPNNADQDALYSAKTAAVDSFIENMNRAGISFPADQAQTVLQIVGDTVGQAMADAYRATIALGVRSDRTRLEARLRDIEEELDDLDGDSDSDPYGTRWNALVEQQEQIEDALQTIKQKALQEQANTEK